MELTPREREVLIGIAEGKTVKQIALERNRSPKTTETQRARLMDKLGIHTVAGLTRYALKNKLIEDE